MNIALDSNQKQRISNLGLVNTTTARQKGNGYTSFYDPQTSAKYTFSPRGYLWRRSKAGQYQLNPRFFVPGSGRQDRQVQATVRTNDAGALVEILVKGVKNFRN